MKNKLLKTNLKTNLNKLLKTFLKALLKAFQKTKWLAMNLLKLLQNIKIKLKLLSSFQQALNKWENCKLKGQVWC